MTSFYFLGFYLMCYYIVKAVVGGYDTQDFQSTFYKLTMFLSYGDAYDFMLNEKMMKVAEIVNKQSSDKEHAYIYEKELEEAQKELELFATDEEYKKRSIDKFFSDVTVKYYARRAFVYLKVVLKEMYQLIPFLVAILTQNIQYGIIASGVVMIVHALIHDHAFIEDVSSAVERETVEEVVFSSNSMVGTAVMSFSQQLHFYIFIAIVVIMN